jgi:hypothetical protein
MVGSLGRPKYSPLSTTIPRCCLEGREGGGGKPPPQNPLLLFPLPPAELNPRALTGTPGVLNPNPLYPPAEFA